jgi:uncharacterized membrane protein
MMSLPLHPAAVHLPLGLSLAAPALAAGLALAVWRKWLPRSSFAILVGAQVVLVASGLVSVKLGEGDGERIEKWIGEKNLEAHEERARIFLIGAGAVLAGAVALLFVPPGAVLGLSAGVVAASIAVAGIGAWTGEAGGELVYHLGAATPYLTRDAPPAPGVGGGAPAEDER